jgi:hypothetical protein
MPDLLAELAGRTAELRPEELAEVARVPEASPGGDGAGGQVRQVWIGEIPVDAVHPPLADVVPDGVILPAGRACTAWPRWRMPTTAAARSACPPPPAA